MEQQGIPSVTPTQPDTITPGNTYQTGNTDSVTPAGNTYQTGNTDSVTPAGNTYQTGNTDSVTPAGNTYQTGNTDSVTPAGNTYQTGNTDSVTPAGNTHQTGNTDSVTPDTAWGVLITSDAMQPAVESVIPPDESGSRQIQAKIPWATFREIETDAGNGGGTNHAYMVDTLMRHRELRQNAAVVRDLTGRYYQAQAQIKSLTAALQMAKERIVEQSALVGNPTGGPAGTPQRGEPGEPKPGDGQEVVNELRDALTNVNFYRNELATSDANVKEARQKAHDCGLALSQLQVTLKKAPTPLPGPTARQMHDAYFELVLDLCGFASQHDGGLIKHTKKFYVEEAKRLYDQRIPQPA